MVFMTDHHSTVKDIDFEGGPIGLSSGNEHLALHIAVALPYQVIPDSGSVEVFARYT